MEPHSFSHFLQFLQSLIINLACVWTDVGKMDGFKNILR